MILKVEDLSFGYNINRKVLNNINFSVNSTESIGILGVSGCGKSTILKLISGIIKKDTNNLLEGSISIDGLSPYEYIKKGKLGFMFQENALMPNLTVRENVNFLLKVKGIKNYSKVDNFLEMVGLKNASDNLPKQLSGGMKTRVNLARSFITEPELLLLDEPFTALDIGWKHTLYSEYLEFKRKFKPAIIIVSHDINEIITLSSKVIVLGKHGKIIKSCQLEPGINQNIITKEIEEIIIKDHENTGEY